MTVEEFIKKTHAVIHDEAHFRINIPVCSNSEQEYYEQYAKEYKAQIMEALHEQQWLADREDDLRCVVKRIYDIERQWEKYNYSFQQFLNSDNAHKPKMPSVTVRDAVSRLNRREYAYLLADRYAQSGNFVRAEIGEEAKKKIVRSESGLSETYSDIITEMKEKWLDYCKGKNNYTEIQ